MFRDWKHKHKHGVAFPARLERVRSLRMERFMHVCAQFLVARFHDMNRAMKACHHAASDGEQQARIVGSSPSEPSQRGGELPTAYGLRISLCKEEFRTELQHLWNCGRRSSRIISTSSPLRKFL